MGSGFLFALRLSQLVEYFFCKSPLCQGEFLPLSGLSVVCVSGGVASNFRIVSFSFFLSVSLSPPLPHCFLPSFFLLIIVNSYGLFQNSLVEESECAKDTDTSGWMNEQ